MVSKRSRPENIGIPLRDPRDRSTFGPLSSDVPRLPPEEKPRPKPRRDPSPDVIDRKTPSPVPEEPPRREP